MYLKTYGKNWSAVNFPDVAAYERSPAGGQGSPARPESAEGTPRHHKNARGYQHRPRVPEQTTPKQLTGIGSLCFHRQNNTDTANRNFVFRDKTTQIQLTGIGSLCFHRQNNTDTAYRIWFTLFSETKQHRYSLQELVHFVFTDKTTPIQLTGFGSLCFQRQTVLRDKLSCINQNVRNIIIIILTTFINLSF